MWLASFGACVIARVLADVLQCIRWRIYEEPIPNEHSIVVLLDLRHNFNPMEFLFLLLFLLRVFHLFVIFFEFVIGSLGI